jgi:hypothetical protein
MRLNAHATLYLLMLPVCGSPLAAQTFTFGPPKPVAETSFSGIAQVQTADINGDGNTDVLIPSALGQYDVYLGDGAGGFSQNPLTANSWYFGTPNPQPTFIDVNGDGIADQVIGFGSYDTGLSTAQGQFLVALGDGKGRFTLSTSLGGLPAGVGYGDPLVAADFDGDGKIDFALLTSGGIDASGIPASAAITVFLNRGNGKFAQQKNISLEGSGIWMMVAGDFNGDGRQDLAWALKYQGEAIPTPYRIHYMYGNGDGSFGTMRVYTTDTAPVALASGDLNGDHKTDLVVGLAPVLDQNGLPQAAAKWRIATLLAKQTEGFYWAHAILSLVTPTSGLELMDLNHDGHLDAIYDWNYLRAGLPGGAFGPHQVPTGQSGDVNGWNFVDEPFAPLVKGGLPAVFSQTVDSSGTAHIYVQLNTSKP